MAQQQPIYEAGGARPSNYRELYAAAGYQAGEPEPALLVASYRFNEVGGGGERPTPAILKEQTFAFSERRSMTFLCLSRGASTKVEVRVLHRMLRYFELPGGVGGSVVDLSLGLLGDVRSAQIPVVEVDNSQFSLIGGAGVRVPKIAVMADQLEAAPPGNFLGPYAADAPAGHRIRTPTHDPGNPPPKYAAVMVHRDAISPATAYRELYGILEADGALETCADVLAWLRVACTARGGGGDLPAIPAVAQTFALLLLPTSVSDYVAAKVLTDLPGRAGGGGGAVWPCHHLTRWSQRCSSWRRTLVEVEVRTNPRV